MILEDFKALCYMAKYVGIETFGELAKVAELAKIAGDDLVIFVEKLYDKTRFSK